MTNEQLAQPHYFTCDCYSDEHTLRFHYIPNSKVERFPDQEIYTSVFLSEQPFWKRVVKGVRYIFGYKCKYGHFDCFILRPADTARLIELLQACQKDMAEPAPANKSLNVSQPLA